MARKHRDYQNDYPSVTTVLGVLRKIGLENWYKVNTIKFINDEMKRSKEIGTQIHKAIEMLINGEEVKFETDYNEEVMNVLRGYMLFKKENPSIKMTLSELRLTSTRYSFNGTMDVLSEIDGIPIIGDFKSGKAKDKEKPDIYDEYKYQVSAYCYLYNEVNNTNIDRAYILSMAKDKIAYNLEFLNKETIEGSFNEVFLPSLRILNYQRRK